MMAWALFCHDFDLSKGINILSEKCPVVLDHYITFIMGTRSLASFFSPNSQHYMPYSRLSVLVYGFKWKRTALLCVSYIVSILLDVYSNIDECIHKSCIN